MYIYPYNILKLKNKQQMGLFQLALHFHLQVKTGEKVKFRHPKKQKNVKNSNVPKQVRIYYQKISISRPHMEQDLPPLTRSTFSFRIESSHGVISPYDCTDISTPQISFRTTNVFIRETFCSQSGNFCYLMIIPAIHIPDAHPPDSPLAYNT